MLCHLLCVVSTSWSAQSPGSPTGLWALCALLLGALVIAPPASLAPALGTPPPAETAAGASRATLTVHSGRLAKALTPGPFCCFLGLQNGF